ncbi:MAG: N-acetylmuramic acid 6-phosphate etherase [Planctomycetes bacterium]|nr:N-acetylmuramic acid 6-phosphate etherase [Planctomycetota bacterium]
MTAEPASRGHLATERENPASRDLDALSTADALALFRREDARVLEALEQAAPALERAVDLVAARLAAGGRLVYVGAGTSGRLGVLDAVECPPTFRSDPRQVVGVLAGGRDAMFAAVEGAEDDRAAGARDLEALAVDARDAVLGISAGGTTPYVHGALAEARERGAATLFLACVPASEVPDDYDVSLRLETGPELVQGSTRLKAGTATKLALNALSTLVMVRLGKVHGNRMVDVNTRGNAKLRDRGLRLVEELAGVTRDAAGEWLDAAEGSVKLAVLMARRGLGASEARAALQRAEGSLRRALG